jgi:hypothetical protein
VAYLEHLTKVVESHHAGGVGSSRFMCFSLHRSWSIELDAFSPTARRGICAAAGPREWQRRLLRGDHLNGGAMAGV